MATRRVILGLDVGTKRIGVAVADSVARVAQPLPTLLASQTSELLRYLHDYQVTDIVVGRPRNQAGETTTQTVLVEDFVASTLAAQKLPIHWQDESMTSVIAEERLKGGKKPYAKVDIDAEAAAIILQDYLEVLQ